MRSLLLIILLLTIHAVYAQENSPFTELETLFNKEDYKGCLAIEKKVIEWIGARVDTTAADTYSYLGTAHRAEGSLDQAIIYFEKEEAILNSILPIRAEYYRNTIYSLAVVYLEVHDFEKARIAAQKSLRVDKELHGIESEEYFLSAFNYADVLVSMGALNEAEKQLEILMKEVPDFSQKNGLLLSKLAKLYRDSGKYKKAERYFIDALQLLNLSEGIESENYNVALANYGSLLRKQGKYDQAEEILDQIVAIIPDKDWYTESNYYASINNLAEVKRALGQYSTAEGLYKKLMSLDSASIGINHPDFSVTLSNLGLLYIDQGKYKKAVETIQSSIQILKSNKMTQSVSYGKRLNNLAKAYQLSGNLSEASSLLSQALKLYKKHFGEQSVEYSFPLFNLGVVYMHQRSSKALPVLKEALSIREKTLGKNHPLYAECEERIAQYYWMNKNKAGTDQSYRNVFENYYGQIDSYFPVLTEEEKSNFFFQKVKPSIESYASFSVSKLGDVQTLGRLLDYHLNTKGIILQATEKVRKSILASGDTVLIARYEKWENAKDILTYYYSIRQSQHKIDSLILVSNDLEKSLVRQSASFAKNLDRSPITWKSIQEKLKPGEAALECLRYRMFNPDSVNFTNDIGYAFLLLTSETKDGPILINLSNGKDMESRYLNYYRNGIRLKLDDGFTYKNYWELIHDQLKKMNVTKVYFSPDGVYNTINIGSIKNPFNNGYLVDELDIRRVTSTRSLLEEIKVSKNKGVGYLFGFPQYKIAEGQSSKITHSVNGSGTRSFRGGMLRFLRNGQGINPLPGTKVEVEQISLNLKKYYSSVQTKLTTEAVESEIKNLSNPSLIHIATHGYFLDDQDGGELIKMPNPLMMSGLILAGAENFIQTGINPLQSNDDGILTAYEVMNLDLDETKLVVLSACETGLGKVQAGEGVYGLQRAFQVAGAESIIMSLWSVDDTATQMLMNIFYEQYLQTNNLYDSFRTAQQKLKEKYPDPFYWGAFILVGKGN